MPAAFNTYNGQIQGTIHSRDFPLDWFLLLVLPGVDLSLTVSNNQHNVMQTDIYKSTTPYVRPKHIIRNNRPTTVYGIKRMIKP